MRTNNAEKERVHEVPERSARQNRSASPSDAVRDLEAFAAGGTAVDATLAALVETKLSEIYPCRVAKAEEGMFTVDVEAALLQEARLVEEYNLAAKEIAGVQGVRVHILPSSIWGLG